MLKEEYKLEARMMSRKTVKYAPWYGTSDLSFSVFLRTETAITP